MALSYPARLPRNILEVDRQHRLNFERWSNSSDALRRLHVLDNVLTGVDLVWAQHSLNPDIIARGKVRGHKATLWTTAQLVTVDSRLPINLL